MLRLSRLHKTFVPAGQPRVTALHDVTLELSPGDFIAVRGPSGGGKSTLLLTAGGLQRPDSGRVLLDDTDLYALSPGERATLRGTRIGFVFQQFHLIDYLSVLENVLAASLPTRRDDAEERAKQLLQRFGMTSRLHHRPPQLSVGEKQRTALARALLNDPAVLLADEPTGNLDEANAAAVLDAMAEFAEAGGMVLLVTHDRDAAARAPRSIEIREGRLVEVPTATDPPRASHQNQERVEVMV